MGSKWLMTTHRKRAFHTGEVDKGSQFVLRASPDYWKFGQPALETTVIRHVPEPTNQLLLIRRGDADAVTDLTPEQVKQLRSIPESK